MRLLGVFNEDVNVSNASDFGINFGSMINEPFIIGSDARYGSLPMKLAVSSGLLSSGCNVADIGYVPAPVLARIARQERVWGISVSADPYPADYVGLRVYDPSGKPWDGKIEPNGRRGVGRLGDIDLVPNYMSELIAKYEIEPLSVVIDSANGPTGRIVPSILRSMGMQVMEMNSSLSPIPSRNYEPSYKNTRDLEFIVRKKRADVGIAFDGSGGKASFVIRTGHISAGRAMALLMKFGGYDRAVADFGATSLLDLVGVVERVPASEVKVAEKLHSKGFEIGGGTMGVAFSEWSYAPDALILSLELMNAASHQGETIESLNSQLPDNYEMAETVRVSDVSIVLDEFEKAYSSHELDLRDGVKILKEEGWIWLKPMKGMVRLAVESESKGVAKDLLDEGLKVINHFIK
ncbi:MAG: hypothetical protein GOU98_00230 [Candidatus Altiarchaeota archaeon]|nr:hypothetical protein [Candidatus Altiarchaeota archaeon]